MRCSVQSLCASQSACCTVQRNTSPSWEHGAKRAATSNALKVSCSAHNHARFRCSQLVWQKPVLVSATGSVKPPTEECPGAPTTTACGLQKTAATPSNTQKQQAVMRTTTLLCMYTSTPASVSASRSGPFKKQNQRNKQQAVATCGKILTATHGACCATAFAAAETGGNNWAHEKQHGDS